MTCLLPTPGTRENGVVPVTMELVGFQVDGEHLLVGEFHVLGVLCLSKTQRTVSPVLVLVPR